MAGRPPKLTDDVLTQIVQLIRAGAYDWIAAESAGISRSTFYRWMAFGEEGQAPYTEFAEQVTIARAQARAAAEIEVRRDNPAFWLRVGPGRSRPGAPGWTERQELAVEGASVRFTLALGDRPGDAP